MRILASAFLMVVIPCSGWAEGPKPGKVVTLPSGLKYQDVEIGIGRSVNKGDDVEIAYTGWIARGGKKFDSSHDRKMRPRFEVGAGMVIQGWDEGLIGMKTLGKRRLYVPARLAYGAKGEGHVPPDADLVFEIELVRILPVER